MKWRDIVSNLHTCHVASMTTYSVCSLTGFLDLGGLFAAALA